MLSLSEKLSLVFKSEIKTPCVFTQSVLIFALYSFLIFCSVNQQLQLSYSIVSTQRKQKMLASSQNGMDIIASICLKTVKECLSPDISRPTVEKLLRFLCANDLFPFFLSRIANKHAIGYAFIKGCNGDITGSTYRATNQ